MDFAGFDDWVEIFRGGPNVDSEGRSHDGDAQIKRMMATFDLEKHEPPVVIGHPKTNAPAYGWVSDLKTAVRDGKTILLAKAKDVAAEFEKMVEQGRFKKRSISIGPDGRLRHVGFLGAAAPAIKGLADIGFADDQEAIFFEENINRTGERFFAPTDRTGDRPVAPTDRTGDRPVAPTTGGKTMELGQITEFIKGLGLRVVPQKQAPEGAEATVGKGGQFSEADVKAAEAKAASAAAEEARKQAEKEYEEAQAEADATAEEKAAKVAIADWVAGMIKAGKLPPAQAPGVQAFAESLVGKGNATNIEFAETEGGDPVKKPRLDYFKGLIETQDHGPLFAEFATKDRAGKTDSDGATWNADLDNKV